MRKNKSKVCLVKSSFDQHFPSTSHDCVAVPFLVRPFFWLLNKIKVSLTDTIDFNKHDIDIFINDT